MDAKIWLLAFEFIGPIAFLGIKGAITSKTSEDYFVAGRSIEPGYLYLQQRN